VRPASVMDEGLVLFFRVHGPKELFPVKDPPARRLQVELCNDAIEPWLFTIKMEPPHDPHAELMHNLSVHLIKRRVEFINVSHKVVRQYCYGHSCCC